VAAAHGRDPPGDASVHSRPSELVGHTEILRGTKSVPAQDVHPGERVVVHAAPREGRLEAGLVNLAAKHK
jgi:hypothetical protein